MESDLNDKVANLIKQINFEQTKEKNFLGIAGVPGRVLFNILI